MSKKIYLSAGKSAVVDEDDYERIMNHKWSYHPSGYAFRIFNKRAIMMHRFILGDPHNKNGYQVDHKNRNGLDNRKQNIWFCTASENLLNRGKFKQSKANKSGYRNCYYVKKSNNWRVQKRIKGKTISIGTYKTLGEAREAYLKYIKDNDI